MGITEKMRLNGNKGFVSGAVRGIGESTAKSFAEAGAAACRSGKRGEAWTQKD